MMKISNLILLLLILASCNNDEDPIDLSPDPELENLRIDNMSIGYDLGHIYHYSDNTIDSVLIILDEQEVTRVFNYTDNKITSSRDTWIDDVLSKSIYASDYSHENDHLVQISSEEIRNGTTTTSITYNEEGKIQGIDYVTTGDFRFYDIRKSSFRFDYDERFNVEKITHFGQSTLNDSITSEFKLEFIYEFDESINPFSIFEQETIVSLNPRQTVYWWVNINPFSQNNVTSVKIIRTNLNLPVETIQYRYEFNEDNLPVSRFRKEDDQERYRIKFRYEYY